MDTQFSTREVPWMKVGTVIDRPVTAKEAAHIGGLDFEVELMKAGYLDGKTWKRAPGRYAIVRKDTGDVFNYATESLELIQYGEAFEFMDSINPTYVAAGALRGGRQGFIVCELPERHTIELKLRGDDDSDTLQLYVVLRTSQDLSRGIEVSLTTLRFKCMNQLTLPSLTRGAPQTWSIRHTKSARARLQEAHDVITRADRYEEAFKVIAEQLIDIDVSVEDAGRMLLDVLPDRPLRDKQIITIMDAFNNSPTVGAPGTGWGLVNATEEYFEHLRSGRGRTLESRFTDGLNGQAHKMADAMTRRLLMA